jgi:DNA invertase Pin-like site-specific DNA recombinase
MWGMYLRISADDKRGGGVSEANSIQGQRRACRAYIERIDPDATIVEFREQDWISASKGLDRPEYRRMLAAMADGSLDHIVARDQDRFTRDRDVEFGELKKLAKQAGVGVHAADSGDLFESDEREMASGIRSEFGQFYSRILAKNVRRGTQTRREQGYWTGAKVYGYLPGGEIHQEQAKQIRWAYDQLLNRGATAQDVFDHWRATGVLTRTGKPWPSVAAVIRMLKSPTIAGLVSHNGEILTDVQARWEPIVSPDERDRLIEYFHSRRKNDRGAYGQRVRRTRMLAGKVLCGHDGCDLATMTGSQPGNRPYYYYQHSHRNGGCDNRTRGDRLDALARAVAVHFITRTPAPEARQATEFDNTELTEITRQIEEVRAELVAGTMRASDARPVLDGLHHRLEEQDAAKREHEQAAQTAATWHVAQAEAIKAGDHDAVRAVIDNVRVLPDHKGFVFEGANKIPIIATRVADEEHTGYLLELGELRAVAPQTTDWGLLFLTDDDVWSGAVLES